MIENTMTKKEKKKREIWLLFLCVFSNCWYTHTCVSSNDLSASINI